MINLFRRFVQVRKAKRLIRQIDSKLLTFDEARQRGLLPPLVTSYWLLQKVANSGSIFS